MTNRKALIIGIDKYENNELNCCVNDANSISNLLEFNKNETRNFSIKKLLDSKATYDEIMEGIKSVFTNNCDVGLFYFSGHGFDNDLNGKIVTFDYKQSHNGISFHDLLEAITKSKCKNKIVILDCCYSGKLGNFSELGDATFLPCGTTILTACNKKGNCFRNKWSWCFFQSSN